MRARRRACLDEEPRLPLRLSPLRLCACTLSHVIFLLAVVGGVPQRGEAWLELTAASCRWFAANFDGGNKVSLPGVVSPKNDTSELKDVA